MANLDSRARIRDMACGCQPRQLPNMQEMARLVLYGNNLLMKQDERFQLNEFTITTYNSMVNVKF